MFIHYWFNALTPELDILSNQVDLRYIDYETLKTLHQSDWNEIEKDLSGGAALEDLFHFDFCQRRDAFNRVIHALLKQLNKSYVNMKNVASKFSLFDLSDLIPTALDDKRFDEDFLSALRTFSTPERSDLLRKFKTESGRLSNEDHGACLANIYYSLNNDLMSSGDIKMMFILMDRIKDMCVAREIFQPQGNEFYNEVLHEERISVSPDVHLNYILAFQKKMDFSNPEVQRHGTLSSAINEYIYNAEKSRRSDVEWTIENNPYRAKDGANPAGMGEKLIRWFPRMGDALMGTYSGSMDDNIVKLLTPKYEYIDHSLLGRQFSLYFLESNPPWLNTLYQKKFYWFLLGVFNIPDLREEFKIESLKEYLNEKIKKTHAFKSDRELRVWLQGGSLESKLFNKGQFLWVRGGRTADLVMKVRVSLFKWYNIHHRIDGDNITSRI